MSRPRFKVVHWRAHGYSLYHPHCRPSLRVPEKHTTNNVDLVTCKSCRKELKLP